jgi:hypothetical protein
VFVAGQPAVERGDAAEAVVERGEQVVVGGADGSGRHATNPRLRQTGAGRSGSPLLA